MNLNAQISALETQLKQRDARILKLTQELKAARRYIHELTRCNRVNDDDVDMDEDEAEDVKDTTNTDEEDETQEANPPQVLILDDVYACCDCGTEVLDGVCQNYDCGMEHQWPPNDSFYANYSINTESLATHPDRSLVPRGDTPVRGVEVSGLPPQEYRHKVVAFGEPSRPDRSVEYWNLIMRGATRLMCETFHLEYTHTGGIYAWADSDIFDEFSGPLMEEGHTWKIYLGRRIELEDGDVDGSRFIEDLLEDAVLFPANIAGYDIALHEWETKQETPGVWVTRPKARIDDEQYGDEADPTTLHSHPDCACDRHTIARDQALVQPVVVGAIALDEYLSDSTEDDEEDLGQPADDLMSEDDDDDDDDDSSVDSNSDSEDVEVHDTAFASLTGPDRVWDPDMEDTSESSEGEDENEDL